MQLPYKLQIGCSSFMHRSFGGILNNLLVLEVKTDREGEESVKVRGSNTRRINRVGGTSGTHSEYIGVQ